jgi:hypothetical protein
VTVLDEASWYGQHELVNVLKSLTGNDTMTVEEKFGGRYQIENFSRYIVTSNDIEAVKIEKNNRRFLVLEMSENHRHLCGPLWERVKDGSACRVLYGHLLRHSIEGFQPWEFPEELDVQGHATKIKSMGPIGEFWADVLLHEGLPLWKSFNELDRGASYAAFERYAPKRYSVPTKQNFWRETEEKIPILADKYRRVRSKTFDGHVYVVTVEDVRESFCRTNRLSIGPNPPDLTDYMQGEMYDPEDF